MSILGKTFTSFTSSLNNLLTRDGKKILSFAQVRFRFRDIEVPKPGKGNYFRRRIHYQEKYTIKQLKTTNLAGRDPKTGRVVVGTLGGGIKWPFLWVDHKRKAPGPNEPLLERVIEVMPEPNRSSHVALVGHGDKLRYILATENMKRGDMIVTSTEITRNAVRPNEGDSYPLGSLPMGILVCCVEKYAGHGAFFARAAGTYCTTMRKIGNRVILQMPDKKSEFSLHQECMAVVGRISNKIHASIPIGSAWRLRHLGYRPRSGLWQRKTGKHGRKIRAPPPVKDFDVPPIPREPFYKLTLENKPFHLP